MSNDFPLDGDDLSYESLMAASDLAPDSSAYALDGLASLYLGDMPEVIGQQLFACPTLVRLDRVLRNHDGVPAGELQHIALCPDCVSRTRAFRRTQEVATRKAFEERLDKLRPVIARRSTRAADAENDARLCFTLIGQDVNLDVWQAEAWRCSHSIARDLRKERELGAPVEHLGVILELRLTAIASAAANPMAACARMFDAAWPLVEMVKEAAAEVASFGPPLFSPFARSIGIAARIGGERMRAMLAYACIELMARGETESELAVMAMREIAAEKNGEVPLFPAALIHRRSALPAALRSSLAANLVNARRLHDVIRVIVRARQSADRILAEEGITTAQAIARILPTVRRFVDDLHTTDDPEEALLRLVALRRFLTDISKTSPDNGVSMTAVFRAIGESLVMRANANRASGSTFLIIKAVEIVRDAFPAAFAMLADLLPSLHRIVRQGLILCAAEGFEAGYDVDAFYRKAVDAAKKNHDVREHVTWLNVRLRMPTAEIATEVKW